MTSSREGVAVNCGATDEVRTVYVFSDGNFNQRCTGPAILAPREMGHNALPGKLLC